jgi:hypothetical protein
MIDSDNVLLLRPAHPDSEFQFKNDRPPVGTKVAGIGLIVGTAYYFDAPVTDDFVGFFEKEMKPAFIEAGASVLAYFVTERTRNNFPRLPVREGENVFVWFSSFETRQPTQLTLLGSQDHNDGVVRYRKSWRNGRREKPEVLKLSPTGRSRLRG